MMKKRALSALLAAGMLLSSLAACTPSADETPTPTPTAQTMPEPTPELTPEPTPPPVCNLTVATADLPQAQFAGEDILAAAQKHGVEEDWKVSVETIDESLGYEAYKVEVSPEELTITVTGGDANGLMYGGLEVAEHTPVASLLIEGGACTGVMLADGTTVRSDHVVVAAGSGLVEIQCLQAPGKKALDAEAFLRGRRIEIGERLGDCS